MGKIKPVAWKSLQHAKGAATRVPAQIQQLATGIASTSPSAEDPYWVFRSAVVSEGTWFSASGRTADLLLETAASAADPVPLFVLAADVIGADQLRGWLSPAETAKSEEERAAREAAVARKEVLFSALSAPRGDVRGAAAMTLAMVPELGAESTPRLLKLALEGADPIARAGALLALGRLGIGDAKAAETIASCRAAGEPGLVRGAAGMASLRQDTGLSFEAAGDEIEQWLGFALDIGVELPWFRTLLGTWYRAVAMGPDGSARSLLGVAQARDASSSSPRAGSEVEALEHTLFTLAKDRRTGSFEAQAAKILLAIGGYPRDQAPECALAQDLTPSQREMAKRLAMTHLLPGGGHGLPMSGLVRRRWIGVDPPGPLDGEIKTDTGGLAPLWRMWSQRGPQPGDMESPLDRWESVTEFASGSYPPFSRNGMKPPVVDAELAMVPVDEALFGRIERMANDFAERFAAVERTGMIGYIYYAMSALLLIPWIRAKRPVAPAWDRLIHVGAEPHSREILEAIPLERRENVLIDYMRGGLPMTRWGRAIGAVAVLDVAPTAKVGAACRLLLDQIASQPGGEARATPLRAQLEALAEKHPDLTGS